MTMSPSISEVIVKEERRAFIRDLAASAGLVAALAPDASALAASTPATSVASEKTTVRDRFWMYSTYEGFTGFPAVPGNSRMTPAEAAAYFNLPNVYVAAFAYGKEPCKLLPPLDYHTYLNALRPFKRVVWFLPEEMGIVTEDTLRTLHDVILKYPNVVGLMLDDYFVPTIKGNPGSPLTLEEIDYVQRYFRNIGGRNVDLWVVLYRHNFEQDVEHVVPTYLNKVDVLTYWDAWAREIETLEEDFAKAERLTPGKRKLLGCYMWDFGDNKPIPLPLMQKQCRLGLQWLREGRIEGMMFLGNFLCDRPLEAVEWTRRWIQEVGNEPL